MAVDGGGLVRAARKRVVVVEMEIAWGVWAKCAASPRVFMARGGELFLLKGKSHAHGHGPQLALAHLSVKNLVLSIPRGTRTRGDVDQRREIPENFCSCSPAVCVPVSRSRFYFILTKMFINILIFVICDV